MGKVIIYLCLFLSPSLLFALEDSKERTFIDGISYQMGSDRAGLFLYSEVTEMVKVLAETGLPSEYLHPATAKSPPREQALQFLINRHLIDLSCKERGFPVTDEDVDKQINKIIASKPELKTEKDLKAALAMSGKSLDSFRGDLRNQLLFVNFQKIAGMSVKVTRADLEKYYEIETGEKAESIKVKTKKMLIPCQKSSLNNAKSEAKCGVALNDARALHAELVSGQDFKKVVQGYSSATLSEEEDSYDLNSLGSEVLREEFKILPVGGYTTPVFVGSSVYIFKILDKEVSISEDFDENSLKAKYFSERISSKIKSELEKLQSSLEKPVAHVHGG